MTIEKEIYKLTCDKWLNKISGDIVYVDNGYDFGKNNQDWFLIPSDATCATYTNNNIRSDVLLFWKHEYGKWYIMNQQSKEWFTNGTLYDSMTKGTYTGKIIWSLYK